MSPTYIVLKTPRSNTWGVYEISSGYNRLVEGGFFSKDAAEASRDEWKAMVW